ncbi:MAG: YicC family protein [Candidatus Lambdaproteobacteria bacterium RIFOXYD12_FULL_49_8]|uniref:YicC family protein n=1 Tax=Candidatus Lambdaproteobacteria bacterium RIFOXYD2_FULL_50_16 TaxID=1817772 RepID=A0A1F6GAC6_9PROT|nr:MAG: YicC family protein [Candidatus Lambdaproteobacteria bacterium RIFOXYD2_FULL_50_16]OGG98294.1 MAG: YicC family protein [Candidatus Lambdaproteobacteria bacterium RIFOXYD12_FULL_49_8]
MIKSMTGFCKVELSREGRAVQVEMRSVNHRHLDTRIYLPKSFGQFEEELKKGLKTHLNRGKVDINLTLEEEKGCEDRLQVNEKAMGQFKGLLSQLETQLGRPVSLSFEGLMQVKGLLVYNGAQAEDFDYLALFGEALELGAQKLSEMRATEGGLLKIEILGHLKRMEELIGEVSILEPEVLTAVQTRLKQNLAKLELEISLDDPRIIQEIGLYMDRADVTEEVERFSAHLTHLGQLLEAGEPVGRKLDFMMQELNREANTLCSKASHQRITEIGVTLKAEIEKLREQIQNIE